MRSVADDLRREQRERAARMTPAERMALTARLGEEGLASRTWTRLRQERP